MLQHTASNSTSQPRAPDRSFEQPYSYHLRAPADPARAATPDISLSSSSGKSTAEHRIAGALQNFELLKDDTTRKQEEKSEKQTLGVSVDEVIDHEAKHQVDLLPEEHPQHFPSWRKWLIVVIVSCCSFCVTGSSSMVCLIFRVPALMFILYSSLYSGSVHGSSCCTRIPRLTRTYCSFCVPVRRRHGAGSFTHRTNIGNLWAEYHIPSFIHVDVCVFMGCGICTECW